MNAPVFVKIEKYKEVEETIRHIKSSIQEAKEMVHRISEMKSEEEQELHMWNEDLKQMEEKISTVEHAMLR